MGEGTLRLGEALALPVGWAKGGSASPWKIALGGEGLPKERLLARRVAMVFPAHEHHCLCPSTR